MDAYVSLQYKETKRTPLAIKFIPSISTTFYFLPFHFPLPKYFGVNGLQGWVGKVLFRLLRGIINLVFFHTQLSCVESDASDAGKEERKEDLT